MRRRTQDVLDVLVVPVAVLGTGVTGLWSDGSVSGKLVALLAIAAAFTLWWRRAQPVAVFVVVVAANLAHLLVAADGSVPVEVGTLVAAYSLAVHGRSPVRETLAVVAGASIAAASAFQLPDSRYPVPIGVAVGLAVVGLPWGIGELVLDRRRVEAERAARVVAEQEAAAFRAVVEERTRIARELHDVVAHHVSLMGMQAGAARMALAQGGPAAVDPGPALGLIEQTSRVAIEEMRRLLGVLRAGAPVAGQSPAPQPGLADLPALAESFRAAGLGVDLLVETGPGVSEIVQLNAYRIVEQSLTNVLEHAGKVSASVRVSGVSGAANEEVRIDVENGPPSGPPAAPGPGRGHGLVGMRERAALFGGSVESGVRPDGGYRVHARLFPEDR